MEKESLIRLIRENLENGKLPCGRAFELANEYNLTLEQIGRVCNEENIRIKNCRLGCF